MCLHWSVRYSYQLQRTFCIYYVSSLLLFTLSLLLFIPRIHGHGPPHHHIHCTNFRCSLNGTSSHSRHIYKSETTIAMERDNHSSLAVIAISFLAYFTNEKRILVCQVAYTTTKRVPQVSSLQNLNQQDPVCQRNSHKVAHVGQPIERKQEGQTYILNISMSMIMIVHRDRCLVEADGRCQWCVRSPMSVTIEMTIANR